MAVDIGIWMRLWLMVRAELVHHAGDFVEG